MKPGEYSENKRAEKVMGLRPTDGLSIDFPVELGYKCPVCDYVPEVNGEYDERLSWSEYNGFIYCHVCNKDYPTALCCTDIDKAIEVFINTVEALA